MGSELTAPAVAGLAGKLDRVPELAGVQRTVTELPGGLTNHNYKVTTGAGAFVARVWSGGGDFLAINRDHEHHNSVAAARAGVGAPVVAGWSADALALAGGGASSGSTVSFWVCRSSVLSLATFF